MLPRGGSGEAEPLGALPFSPGGGYCPSAGIGATPAARASLAGVANRWAPAISPTSLAAVKGPNPGSECSCGAIAATSLAISRPVP